MIDPAGPAARAIATLWWVMLIGGTLIFAGVVALLVLAFRHPNSEPRAGQGEESATRVWILGLGIAFPAAVLAALLVYGLILGEVLMPRHDPPPVTVSAEARQWDWSFGYAEAPGRVTAGILHIPAGRPVDVNITTLDVIHSFWVPRLAGKLDAIPGHVNVLRIEADAPGEYAGFSAEYSGAGYLGHEFTVIAHDADGWARFLAGDGP